MLHHVFVALTTQAFVASFIVDALAFAVTTGLWHTFIVIWTTEEETEAQLNKTVEPWTRKEPDVLYLKCSLHKIIYMLYKIM